MWSMIADTLTEALNGNGYDATAAYDGEEAIEAEFVRLPHMLISVVMLSGTNGIALAMTVVRIHPDFKVLLFSGQAIDLLLSSANGGGLRPGLLSKPVHPVDPLKPVATGLGI
jgi:DNA-binding response OmpR family regulator